MLRAGVFGASGYTGHELAQILARHPEVELVFCTSRSGAGGSLRDLYPQAPAVPLIPPEGASLGEVDALFLCLPHTQSAPVAVAGLEAGARVIDLSADFRLRSPDVYRRWYGHEHSAPELLKEAVYGLTEVARGALAAARLVANPGCYPTSALLALFPLAQAGALAGPIFIDSKSGVSGAGRTPKQHTHFVEVANNLSPYNIGRQHRHLPEMDQLLADWSGDVPQLIFSPHLLPVPRGLLSTVYAPLASGWGEGEVREAFAKAYEGETFVQILPSGEHATLAHARETNLCALGVAAVDGTALLTSAIDNLVKGAAGQAVQNMNRMFGMDESEGLL